MEDLQRKRQLIEQGQLTSWTRRGRGAFTVEHLPFHRTALQALGRVTWLRTRGERNARNAVVRPLRFTFDALPPAFCGFTILHLSDIHADGLTGLTESLSERLYDLQVDVCVLTGDYRYRASGPCHDVYPNMEKILACVRARYGIVGVLGNHDAAEKVPELERLGVTMLVNQSLELRHGDDTIWLIGLDDPHYYGCDDLPGALRGVPEETFKVLLVHTPELLADAEASGVDLYLCGHTHGGQICLPFIGPLITGAQCPRRYVRGAWRYKNMQGYTSAGVGVSMVPMRFFCPPEIGLIELRCTRPHPHPSSIGLSAEALPKRED
jgi:predicted MPP superfamily phosphohydrolase